MRPAHRRWGMILVLAGFALLVAVSWAFYRYREASRDCAELEAARRELDAKEIQAARVRLVALAARRPRDGEVAYLLGQSEEATGRSAAALAAWARVGPDSPFAAKAVARRARTLTHSGHLSEAEALLEPFLTSSKPLEPEVRQSLEFALSDRRSDARCQEAHRPFVAGVARPCQGAPTTP